jgi:hypothetical protein
LTGLWKPRNETTANFSPTKNIDKTAVDLFGWMVPVSRPWR